VTERKNQPFFFIQMTDVQFGMFTANLDYVHESELFEKAIACVNRLGPAFAVFTGDLINEPTDEQQTAAAQRIARKLDQSIPFYWVAGNHDIGDTPNQENLHWYRNRFGKDWYSFDTHRCHFVVLNSCILKNNDKVPDQMQAQLEWLQQDPKLSRSQDYNHIIVFLHHPLFLDEPREEDQYFNIPRQNRREYLALFKQYEVKVVFAGHLHQNRLATDHQLQMVTTGPVGMPLGHDKSGLRIIQVFPDKIEHRYYELDDMPERIEMTQQK
jgi:3',5'-cyclic AMP phosphodiesterase CpdA